MWRGMLGDATNDMTFCLKIGNWSPIAKMTVLQSVGFLDTLVSDCVSEEWFGAELNHPFFSLFEACPFLVSSSVPYLREIEGYSLLDPSFWTKSMRFFHAMHCVMKWAFGLEEKNLSDLSIWSVLPNSTWVTLRVNFNKACYRNCFDIGIFLDLTFRKNSTPKWRTFGLPCFEPLAARPGKAALCNLPSLDYHDEHCDGLDVNRSHQAVWYSLDAR